MWKKLIVILIVILGIGGFLGWDWYDKTKRQKLEPSMTLYYWTDAKGGKHISDTPPPENARNIRTDKGFKHIKTPLVVTIKNKAIRIYTTARNKLFKSRKSKNMK